MTPASHPSEVKAIKMASHFGNTFCQHWSEGEETTILLVFVYAGGFRKEEKPRGGQE